MAEYTVVASDGKTYRVQGPEGLPEEIVRMDVDRRLRKQLRDSAPPPEPAPIERTIAGRAGEVFRGLPRGAVGLLETAAIGASALLPEELETSARERIASIGEAAAAPFQPKPGYEDSISAKFGEAAGSTLPFFAAGPFGLAGRVAATGLGAGAGAGTARERAEQGGATDEERAMATGLGSLVGLSEVVVPFRILGNAIGNVPAQGVLNRLRRAAQAGGEEGLQEAAAEVAQNLIERGVYNPEQGAFTGTGESFGYGAGVGGLAQGLFDLFAPGRGRGVSAPPAAEDTVDQTALAAQQREAGDLFPDELDAATSDDQAVAGAMAKQQVAEEDALAAERDALEAAEMQGQEQPDMIDIDETRQIQNLFDDDELARMQQEEDAQLAAQEAERIAAEQALLVQETAQLDTQRDVARSAKSEEKRRQILLPIIESGRIADPTNLARAFSAELRRQGFANVTPSESELATIDRAVGVQQAVTASETEQAETAAALQARQETEQRAGVAPLEALIPERRTPVAAEPAVVSPQEQERAEKARLNRERLDRTGRGLEGQLEIPVIPRATGAAASQETTQETPAVLEQGVSPQLDLFIPLTQADLDAANVPKGAPVRKRVVKNKNASQVKTELETLAANPNTTPEAAASITALAKSIPAAPAAPAATRPPRADIKTSVQNAAKELNLNLRADQLTPIVNQAMGQPDANREAFIREEVGKLAPKSATPAAATTPTETATPAAPTATTPNAEQEFRANVTRLITNANQAKLAEAYQTVVGEAPPADVKTAVKKFSLPEQVAIYNEYNAVQGRNNSVLVLPGRFSVQPKREEAAAIPANARLMDRVRRGDSTADILQGIAQDKDVPQPLRNLARSMLRVAPNITIPVIEQRYKEPDVVGAYVHPQQGDEAIYLDPRSESAAQTFLHEFVHPMTVNAIARGTPEGKRVVQLFEQYKAQHPESGSYGFTNPYEFVAEGITNPKFQSTLKRQNWWGRFVDAIRRIIGLPASQSGTVEELIDLTNRMGAAESATRAQRAAEDVVFDDTPTNNTKFLRLQGEELNSTSKPMRSKPVRDAVANIMGTTSGSSAADAARAVLTWGLPLPALNDYVQSYMRKKGPAYELFADAMQRFTDTAVRYEGALREFTDSITAQIARMGEWKTNNPELYDAMTNLYFGASHAKVDLTKPESEYAGNPEKLSAYKRLKKDFIAIGGSGQAIYRQMRAIHNRQFKQISQQVFDRVYADTKDKGMATRVRDAFVEQMRAKGPLEGYAPMLRPSGKHMLKYVIKGEDAFEIFTNPNDREARKQQLIADGVKEKDIKSFLGDKLSNFDGIVPSSFLGQLVGTLKEVKVDDATRDALIESVMTLGVAMSPPNSVLERLASRKEVAGYVRDPFWAFQEGTMGLGRKLINMQYGAKMNNELRNMQETRKNIGDDPIAASILSDVAKRATYASNPSQAWWSNAFTTATYGWTLGFNVSSAIVDMSSLVLVTGPYLTRTYGWAKTHRAMMQSAKDIMGMGTSADVETLVTQGLEGAELQEVLKTMGTKERDMVRRKTSPSMLNINFNDPVQAKKYGYLKPLVDKVRESGHSERYSELSESAEFGESNLLSKWSARMGFMMNASERFKREIGIKAAYDLELSKFGTAPTPEQMTEAAQKAMEMSLLLNGGSTAVTGARFQQNDIFRIAFMYRRFAALQMYLQAKTAYDSTLNDDPAVKAAARKFAGYTMLTSAAFVGVKGMPMMGTVAALWAMFGAVFGEEDEDNSLDNFLRNNLDPLLVEGIPNILFNANVAGRMEMTNLLIRDSNLPNDATLADGIAAHFGGPTYGSVNRAIRGAELIADGEIQRGVENMLPVAISNIFKSGRFLAEGAVETLRDDVVVEVNPFGALAQGLGFAPADYARAMDFNIGQSNAERRISDRRTGLYEAVYTAYRVGDTDGVAQAMQAIIEFNQRYPEFAITSQGLRQSISGRDRNTQDMVMGRLPSARTRGVTLETAEDWGF
jgi:hypothetical protein